MIFLVPTAQTRRRNRHNRQGKKMISWLRTQALAFTNVKREYFIIFEYYQIVIMDIMDGETPV